MTTKELLDIAQTMDCDKQFEGFYEFANNFLSNPTINRDDKAQSFFESIKVYMDNADKRTVQTLMGKRSGKNNTGEYEIRRWCRYILNYAPLKELTAEELNYVMGYCARIAKIKKAGI